MHAQHLPCSMNRATTQRTPGAVTLWLLANLNNFCMMRAHLRCAVLRCLLSCRGVHACCDDHRQVVVAPHVRGSNPSCLLIPEF